MTTIVDVVGVRIFRKILTYIVFEIRNVTDRQTNKQTNTHTRTHSHKSTDTLSLIIGLDLAQTIATITNILSNTAIKMSRQV